MTVFVEGHTDLADSLWLVGAVLAIIAAILYLTSRPDVRHAGALFATSLALTALGLLVL